MTLRNLLLDNWSLFYHPQCWMVDEPFMDRDVPVTDTSVPRGFLPTIRGDLFFAIEVDTLPDAVLLAARYVAHPHDSYWKGRYFWTADTDSLGQRVYLGDNGKGLEIHRHLHLTERWGTPVW